MTDHCPICRRLILPKDSVYLDPDEGPVHLHCHNQQKSDEVPQDRPSYNPFYEGGLG